MATVKIGGNVTNLTGNEIKVGDAAPVVEVVGQDLSEIKVGGTCDKIQVIAVVPSLDTGVCATETRKFNQNIAGKDGVVLTVISMDLPFAMGRFCSTEGIDNLQVASDFRNKEFGAKYGVLIKDGKLAGLLARSIFVVGKDGNIIYKEIVPELTNEPDYEALAEALKSSGGCCCSGSSC